MPLNRFFIFFFLFLFSTALDARKKTPVASALSNAAIPTVVVDAGHGGTDRGTRSRSPFCEEKKLCLQTAKLVKKYLDQLGYHVVMTRNTDAFIPLSRRVEIATQARSSVFVSIHYNAAKNPTANGMEIFFYDTKEDKNRSIASKKLAEAILPGLIRRTNANSRGVKKGNYYVLRENSVPAIIIEGGFMSNREECALLRTMTYQDRIARGIADGIDQYFKMNAS